MSQTSASRTRPRPVVGPSITWGYSTTASGAATRLVVWRTCGGCSGWGTSPVSGGHGLQVVVVVKVPAVTPALSRLVVGGTLYLTQSAVGDEPYF